MKIRSSFLVIISIAAIISCKSYVNHVSGNGSQDGDVPIDDTDGGIDASPDGTIALPDGGSCGGSTGVKCDTGDGCVVNADCFTNVCGYKKICLNATEKSCINYLGGWTCGQGEVEDSARIHESCCRSLPVAGFHDPNHVGKTVWLDKYEITAGRMRAFTNAVIAEFGKPDFKSWVATHHPTNWNDNWNQFLPSDYEGGNISINRMLAGDPRHLGQTQAEAGPGVVLVPNTDPTISTGLNHQFNGSSIFADLHGGNCGTYSGSYGMNTYWYPDDVLTLVGEVPRADGIDTHKNTIKAQDFLDQKSMNCSSNLMFQLFCSFNGGELMSDAVFDFITATPERSLDVSGCGTQYSNHGDLLSNVLNTSVFSGGRCADAYGGGVNLFFDAGQALPVPGSSLNRNFYFYPDLGGSISDKSWTIAAPGRMYNDIIFNTSVNEGWMDLAGNLTETVLDTSSGSFTGKFSLRGQGVGFGSERSDLNVQQIPLMVGTPPTVADYVDQGILRAQRAEAKSSLVGARCQFYR